MPSRSGRIENELEADFKSLGPAPPGAAINVGKLYREKFRYWVEVHIDSNANASFRKVEDLAANEAGVWAAIGQPSNVRRLHTL